MDNVIVKWKSQVDGVVLRRLQVPAVGFKPWSVSGRSSSRGGDRLEFRQAENRLEGFDLIIASTALIRNLTLVTNNEKYFQRIEGVKLDHWCELLRKVESTVLVQT